MGMSRDSLNGTITATNIYQFNENQHEQPLPTLESVSIEEEKQPQVIISKVDFLLIQSNLYISIFSYRKLYNKKIIIIVVDQVVVDHHQLVVH